MSSEFYSLVTDIGAIKQLESVRDGVPFDVYEIALGDSNGEYYTPQTDQTALRNEVWRGLIEKCEWVDNKFYCVTTVPASVKSEEPATSKINPSGQHRKPGFLAMNVHAMHRRK